MRVQPLSQSPPNKYVQILWNSLMVIPPLLLGLTTLLVRTCTRIHTHVHSHISAYTYTYIQTDIQHTHTYRQTYSIHIYLQTDIQAFKKAYAQALIHE